MSKKINKLWQKATTKQHPLVHSYIVSKSLEADNQLFKYDIQASTAHAQMLAKVGLLNQDESEKLTKTLTKLAKEFDAGEFVLDDSFEDMHSAIEFYLTEKLGDLGKKIHTARSRNDQVLVAMRLFMKAKLEEIATSAKSLSQEFLEYAKTHQKVYMPGYSHTQRAMPSSVGQWALSFAESLKDDLLILKSSQKLTSQNPLGSASGFGTSLPIDRQFTTQKLGFLETQINPIYCQNSRGKIEGVVAESCFNIMQTLNTFASDAILYTAKEFNFFQVDNSLTTGSSIMPQKRNLDIMEVLRANTSIVEAKTFEIKNVRKNLTSGYHKDLKITKKPILEIFEITQKSLQIVSVLLQNMTPNQEAMEQALDPEIFATDVVNQMVMDGETFRDAYQKIGNNLDSLKTQNMTENVKNKTHLGSLNNLGFAEVEGKWE